MTDNRRIFYHGSLYHNLGKILKEGIRSDVDRIWNTEKEKNSLRAKSVFVAQDEVPCAGACLTGAKRRFNEFGMDVEWDVVGLMAYRFRVAVFFIDIPAGTKLTPDVEWGRETHELKGKPGGFMIENGIPAAWLVGYRIWQNRDMWSVLPMRRMEYVHLRGEKPNLHIPDLWPMDNFV